MKLEVKNFQSIEEALIDIEGFVVITGPSNRGKSALVRAIGALLFNEAGNESIQNGFVFASVQLSEPSSTMYWHRNNNGKVSLVLNGQPHMRVARDYLTLIAPFGYREVETKQYGFRPQLAMQHESPYLLGLSPNVISEALQVVGRIDIVNLAQKYCAEDKKTHSNLCSTRKKDIEVLEKSLEPYDNFKEVLDDLARATFTTHEAKDKITKYNAVDKNLTFIQRVKDIDPVPGPVEINLGNLVETEIKLREFIKLQQTNYFIPARVEVLFYIEKSALEKKLTLYIKIIRALNNNRASLLQLNIKGQQIKEEILELEEELKVCPECKRPYESTKQT